MHNKFQFVESKWLKSHFKYQSDTALDEGRVLRLAQTALKISDRYANRSAPLGPSWQNQDWIDAYLSYFMPLNWLRLLAVIDAGVIDNFFSQFEAALDFGSGPGTFHLAACERKLDIKNWHFVESAPSAIRAHKSLLAQFNIAERGLTWQAALPTSQAETQFQNQKTLAVFSYALNELGELPKWAYLAEGLCIVEPSTREMGRRLQELRAELIQKGWSIWAPCTHHGACPLLAHSEKDWCHSRIHIQRPALLEAIEQKMGIRNDTVTYSYLLASRASKNPHLSKTNLARTIGDTLFERGKVRQAICRNPQREFLSWLTRYGEPEIIARGERLELPEDIEIKGQEIRLRPKG